MKLTIGKKVTLLAIILLLVPMSIIGSISYFSARDSLNQQGETILKIFKRNLKLYKLCYI